MNFKKLFKVFGRKEKPEEKPIVPEVKPAPIIKQENKKGKKSLVRFVDGKWKGRRGFVVRKIGETIVLKKRVGNFCSFTMIPTWERWL